jgi:hypothetical protein
MDLFHWSSVSTIQLDKERPPREGVSTYHGIFLPLLLFDKVSGSYLIASLQS